MKWGMKQLRELRSQLLPHPPVKPFDLALCGLFHKEHPSQHAAPKHVPGYSSLFNRGIGRARRSARAAASRKGVAPTPAVDHERQSCSIVPSRRGGNRPLVVPLRRAGPCRKTGAHGVTRPTWLTLDFGLWTLDSPLRPRVTELQPSGLTI